MSHPTPLAPFQPRIGDEAPAFSCRSTRGEVQLSDYRGRWLAFFSHPADFTPVCTSEFVAFAEAAGEFDAIGCALLGLSVDSLFSHLAWVRAIEERFGLKIPFPVCEDPSMAIARAYGMLDAAAGRSSVSGFAGMVMVVFNTTVSSTFNPGRLSRRDRLMNLG